MRSPEPSYVQALGTVHLSPETSAQTYNANPMRLCDTCPPVDSFCNKEMSNSLTTVELIAPLLRQCCQQSLLRWSQACCLLQVDIRTAQWGAAQRQCGDAHRWPVWRVCRAPRVDTLQDPCHHCRRHWGRQSASSSPQIHLATCSSTLKLKSTAARHMSATGLYHCTAMCNLYLVLPCISLQRDGNNLSGEPNCFCP